MDCKQRSHLATELFLQEGHRFNFDLANEGPVAVNDGQLVSGSDSLQSKGKTVGVAVGPEVIVVEIVGISLKGDALGEAQADGLQDQRLPVKEVLVASQPPHPVTEARHDSWVNVHTC